MAYSVKSLATRWQCSERHVYNLIDRGELRSFCIGRGKGKRISDEEVQRWERSEKASTETATCPLENPASIGLPTSIM